MPKKANAYEQFFLKSFSKNVGDKPIKDDAKTNIRNAIGAAAGAAAVELLARAVLRKALPLKTQINIGKFYKVKNPGLIRHYDPVNSTLGIVGTGAIGYFNNSFQKRIQDAKLDSSKSDKALEGLRALSFSQRQVVKSGIDKTAFVGAAIRGVGALAKTMPAVGRALAGGLTTGTNFSRRMYGMKPGSKFSVPQRVFGAATQAGALGGAYLGGKAIYNAQKAPKNNYTSLLRNNMFAGKISPDELHQEDMDSVQRLGMEKGAILGAIMGATTVMGTISDVKMNKARTRLAAPTAAGAIADKDPYSHQFAKSISSTPNRSLF